MRREHRIRSICNGSDACGSPGDHREVVEAADRICSGQSVEVESAENHIHGVQSVKVAVCGRDGTEEAVAEKSDGHSVRNDACAICQREESHYCLGSRLPVEGEEKRRREERRRQGRRRFCVP